MTRTLIASTLALVLAGMLAAASPPAAPATPAPAPAAATTAPGDPTLITIHYKNAPPAAVFQDLFGQVGRDYITYPDAPTNWPAVSLDADKEPYWQVVARLNDALGAHTYLRRNGKVAVNRGQPSPDASVRCFSGPCMLLASTIMHTANFTDPDHLDECTLNVMLHIEPNLDVAAYSGRVFPDLAVDERGNSLVPPPPPPATPNSSAFAIRGQGIEPDLKPVKFDYQSYFQVVLRVPANAGYKIAQVKGSAHLKVIEKATIIDIPAADFAQPRSYEFHGAVIAVSAISNTNTGITQPYHVSLNITHVGMPDDDWAKINDLLDAASINILDAKDFPYFNPGSGMSGGRGSVNRIISSSLSPTEGRNQPDYSAGPAVKCRITLPEVIRDVPIPFEFKNLPLP